MANMAECAIAIAKKDLRFMNGAIEKIEDDDGRDKYEYACRMYYEENGKNDEWTLLHENEYGEESYNRYILRKNGEVVLDTEKWDDVNKIIVSNNLQKLWDKDRVLKDIITSNKWKVDWRKLNSFSYDYTPYVHEYEDHVTIYFGGRWDFPSKLEDKLNSYGVLWQGAGCEDSMNWKYDEFGNADFGLRVKSETEYDSDGESYEQHYVTDTSE